MADVAKNETTVPSYEEMIKEVLVGARLITDEQTGKDHQIPLTDISIKVAHEIWKDHKQISFDMLRRKSWETQVALQSKLSGPESIGEHPKDAKEKEKDKEPEKKHHAEKPKEGGESHGGKK